MTMKEQQSDIKKTERKREREGEEEEKEQRRRGEDIKDQKHWSEESHERLQTRT